MNDPVTQPSEERVIKKFLQICYENHYPERTNIIVPGDGGDSLLYVIEGRLSVCMPGKDKRNYILSYLNPGDFIGEMGLFIPVHTREVIIQTSTPCILAKISYARLWNALENELKDSALDFMKFVGRKVSMRLLQSNRKVLTLSSLDVQGRIARALMDLCKEPSNTTDSSGTHIKITREELSRLVGCSRELAGKTLKLLEEKGIITTKGRVIIIPDQNALA